MAAAGFAFLGIGGFISITQQVSGFTAHALLAGPGIAEVVGCGVILLAFVGANVYVVRQTAQRSERMMELAADPATPADARKVFLEILVQDARR